MLIKARPDECRAIIDFAAQEPELNLFLVGDLEFYGMDNDFIEVWKETREDGAFKTVVLRYYRNFLLYSVTNDFDPHSVIQLITENGGRALSGPSRNLEPLFGHLPARWTRHPMTLAVMRELVKPVSPLPKTRQAVPDDAEDIARSLCEIVEFKDMLTETPEERVRNLRRKMIDGFSMNYIIRQDGRVVANANTSAISRRAAMIGGVFTLPEYRNRGLATAVVHDLCKRLLTDGRTPVLFFENPKAASIYHRLGFADLAGWMVVTLPSPDHQEKE